MATPKIHLNMLFEEMEEYDSTTFNKELRDSWITTEFPNGFFDKDMLISLFLESKKELLMNKEELETLDKLPEEVIVYRGIGDEKTKEDGLSWTLDKNIASWFSNRWKGLGKVITAKINKKDIFAVFLEREEKEVVLDSRQIKKEEVEQ